MLACYTLSLSIMIYLESQQPSSHYNTITCIYVAQEVPTFVSRTDMIFSLASFTSSLFPLTLICGSAKQRVNNQQSTIWSLQVNVLPLVFTMSHCFVCSYVITWRILHCKNSTIIAFRCDPAFHPSGRKVVCYRVTRAMLSCTFS